MQHESHLGYRLIGFWLGLGLFGVVLFLPPASGMSPAAQKTAAVTALMVCWWMTEAIPIPVTALAPLLLFPLLGIMNSAAVARPYANENIFLFLGGFCIALAMERWNLHRRIALHLIHRIGDRPRRMILGFMIATAFLSMWISNTATTMMMLPIGLSLMDHTGPGEESSKGEKNFGVALMLGIAYAASIGGMGTLVGSPPNLVFAGQVRELFPGNPEIGFLQWMLVGIPLVLLFLPIAWWILTGLLYPVGKGEGPARVDIVDREIAELGRMQRGERYTLIVFLLTALAWIFRRDIRIGFITLPGWTGLLGVDKMVHDSTIAMGAALLLFILPVNLKKGEFVLDWQTAVKLPWGVLILFGGGFALARGFTETGLTAWIGRSFTGLEGMPLFMMVAGTCLLMTFLTEITSNTATATMILPFLAAAATTFGVSPYLLMVPATLSASCAFMLPVATPPNAIVFGSGRLTIPIMARAGLIMNLIGVVLITLLVRLIAVPVFGMSLTH